MRMSVNFTIDLIILLLFLAGFEPALTGGVVHEWLNLVFAAAMLTHLVMHWDWIQTSMRRKPWTISRLSKVNLLLNILSFLVFVMMLLSGLMISRYVLGSGTAVPRQSAWRELHETFGNLLLVLVALHFALHWQWFVHACKRCLLVPVRMLIGGPPTGERRTS